MRGPNEGVIPFRVGKMTFWGGITKVQDLYRLLSVTVTPTSKPSIRWTLANVKDYFEDPRRPMLCSLYKKYRKNKKKQQERKQG